MTEFMKCPKCGEDYFIEGMASLSTDCEAPAEWTYVCHTCHNEWQLLVPACEKSPRLAKTVADSPNDWANRQEGTQESCICVECIRACQNKPGWFMPGEAEKAAELLGITMQDFFDRYLGVDFWLGQDGQDSVFLLAPGTNNMEPGGMYPARPEGRCLFLTREKRCMIHAAKPFQCRDAIHDIEGNATEKNKALSDEWKPYREQLVQLLKCEPKAPNPMEMMRAYSPMEMLGAMLLKDVPRD